ncbi:MAG: hypothetical protein C3F12_07445 [Candidatus Methylomirabilota bacterium]|nr:hypothetical protein [candidate division NC10 bacterium]PWB45902.1 MAG: hypothetical protein C3F12_07445 [candidate division NC10 bacterium]
MQRSDQRSPVRLRLTSFVAASISLYLLLNAFLILCLIHPHNRHVQHQANGHLASICAWIHKTVAPHAPSTGVMLPVVAATLLILIPLLPRFSQIRIIRCTGRSPPQLCLA